MRDLWYGTRGSRTAKVLVVGEAWGYEEARAEKPFVGGSGQELDRMLAEAGLVPSNCLFTNLISTQPFKNQMWRFFYPREEVRNKGIKDLYGLHPLPSLEESLSFLIRQILALDPILIIACGNYPFWFFSSEVRIKYSSRDNEGTSMEGGGRIVPAGIADFRGSMLRTRRIGDRQFRLLPIIHPAAILRDWAQRAITVGDLKRWRQAFDDDWENRRPPKLNFRPTFNEAFSFLYSLLIRMDAREELEASVDIETTRDNLISCISFCVDPAFAIVIPFLDKEGENYFSYWSLRDEIAISRTLRKVFAHPRFRAIGQNFNYDRAHLEETFGVVPSIAHDTMLAHHMVFPGTPKGLGYLSSLHCRYHRYWKDDNKEWDNKADIDDHLRYNAEDAWRTKEIATEQRKMIAGLKMEKLYQDRLEANDFAFSVSRRGLAINESKRKKLLNDLIQEREKRLNLLLSFIPQSALKSGAKALWPDSPKQLAEVLYDILELPVQKHAKTKAPTTDDSALETLMAKAPAFCTFLRLLREYRSLGVYIRTFLESQLDPDGRMRTTLDATGTETFRFSSYTNPFHRGMNMQNIPT